MFGYKLSSLIVIFRCSFRQLLSINALQSDGSSAVSVWLLTRFRRWIRGGIVVQVLAWVLAWVSSNFERCYSGAYSCIFHAFDVSKVPVLLPLYEVLFADLSVSKDSDICWIFDGWVMDFCECTFWFQYSVQGVIIEKVLWLLILILEKV